MGQAESIHICMKQKLGPTERQTDREIQAHTFTCSVTREIKQSPSPHPNIYIYKRIAYTSEITESERERKRERECEKKEENIYNKRISLMRFRSFSYNARTSSSNRALYLLFTLYACKISHNHFDHTLLFLLFFMDLMRYLTYNFEW